MRLRLLIATVEELITEYEAFDAFARDWDGSTANDVRMLWQLLGELADDEVLIHLPAWLAVENTGFVDGATPTTFVGRIDRETDEAIRFVDSAAAGPLMKQAHRIHHVEGGIENVGDSDDERREWLEERLRKTRREFETREGVPGLTDEWLPKSQLLAVVRLGD